jgi:antitoxin component of MazEF toxin-antitoxin module
MSQLTVISHGDAGAVVLSTSVLESVGLHVGDTLHLTVKDGQLILRPLDDLERVRKMADLTEEVLNRRSDAYRRLA